MNRPYRRLSRLAPGGRAGLPGRVGGLDRPAAPMLMPLLVIFGPTSSGKTALALELAAAAPAALGVGVEIVSADSRQVYAGMNIGTAKVSRAVMMRVPHHCLDLRPPDRPLSLAEYQAEALRQIEAIEARGNLPLLVGGTGSYILSVVENWRVGEMRRPGEPNFRSAGKGPPRFCAAFVRPAVSLSQVLPRIDRAVEAMFAAGLVEEVTALAERYRLWEPGRMARSALADTHGYREFLVAAHRKTPVRFRYTERELREIKTEIQQHTRDYARRQWAWLKKMPPVKAVSNAKEALPVARELLAPAGRASAS